MSLPGRPVSRVDQTGERVGPARQPVLLINPRSGDGKADRVGLVPAAEERGIRAEVMTGGADVVGLARAALAEGADVLGMAGGDGSLALVAQAVVQAHVAFVCVPAGTRNHFARDLGIDRHGVVASLDAFGEAIELRVDLGAITDGVGAERPFVNNVSLGIYGRAVQSEHYRKAKGPTLAQVFADHAGSGSFDYRFVGPDGLPHPPADIVFIGNNPYRLTSPAGFGSRSRLDTGQLGVVTVGVDGPDQLAQLAALELAHEPQRFPGWRQWSASDLVIDSGDVIEAGVDGEAVRLHPPVRLRVVPGAVRVRVPVPDGRHRPRLPRPPGV